MGYLGRDRAATKPLACIDRLSRLIRYCSDELRKRDPGGENPELRTLRRHTFKIWKSSADGTARERLERLFPRWRPLLLLWRSAGNALQPTSEYADEASAFDASTRCNWTECLCNAHKPAHPLRVCKGCRAVVYCHPRCQKRCAVRTDYLHKSLTHADTATGRKADIGNAVVVVWASPACRDFSGSLSGT